MKKRKSEAVDGRSPEAGEMLGASLRPGVGDELCLFHCRPPPPHLPGDAGMMPG